MPAIDGIELEVPELWRSRVEVVTLVFAHEILGLHSSGLSRFPLLFLDRLPYFAPFEKVLVDAEVRTNTRLLAFLSTSDRKKRGSVGVGHHEK